MFDVLAEAKLIMASVCTKSSSGKVLLDALQNVGHTFCSGA